MKEPFFERLRKYTRELLITVLVIAILGFAVYTKFSVWMECRSTNSFFFCFTVLNP